MFKNLVLITFIATLSMGSVLAMPLSELMVKDSINDVLAKNLADLQPEMLEPEPEIAEAAPEPEYYPTPTTIVAEEKEDEDDVDPIDGDLEEEVEAEPVEDETLDDDGSTKDAQVADESEEVIDEGYDDTQFEFPTNRTDPGAFENF